MPVELIALTLFALSQIGTPGPANMALLATGAGYGLRRALPFVAGVVVGKQLIIWPLGFGLMQLAQSGPGVFLALKYLSRPILFIWPGAWPICGSKLIRRMGHRQVFWPV